MIVLIYPYFLLFLKWEHATKISKSIKGHKLKSNLFLCLFSDSYFFSETFTSTRFLCTIQDILCTHVFICISSLPPSPTLSLIHILCLPFLFPSSQTEAFYILFSHWICLGRLFFINIYRVVSFFFLNQPSLIYFITPFNPVYMFLILSLFILIVF